MPETTSKRARLQLHRNDRPFVAGSVDTETGRILGAVIMQTGPVPTSMAPGFPFEVDEETLRTVVELGNATEKGIQGRHNHPDDCNPSHGSQVCRWSNWRIEGDAVLADATMLRAAKNTPHGDLASWTLDMADEAPEQFGVSVWGQAAFEHLVDEHGNEITHDDDGNRLLPKARMTTLKAADFVDPPAAVRGGLFGASLAASAATLLDAAIGEAGIDITADGLQADFLNVLVGTDALDDVRETLTVAAGDGATTIGLNDDDGYERAARFVNGYLGRRGSDITLTASDIATALSKGQDTMPPKPKDGAQGATTDAPEQNHVTLTVRTEQTGVAAGAAPAGNGTAAADVDAPIDPKTIAKAENTRLAEITALGALFPDLDIADTLKACSDDLDCTVDRAKGLVLARVSELQKDSTPATGGTTTTITAGDDARSKFFALASATMERRAKLLTLSKDSTPEERERYEAPEKAGIMNLGPQALCREMLRLGGVARTHLMDAEQMWATAMGQRIIGRRMDTEHAVAAGVGVGHGTGDFPLLMANLGNKSLLSAFELAPTTYQIWVHIGDLNDFKSAKRLRLSEAPHLEERAPGEPAVQGSMAERGESIVLANYAKAFSYTRQMFINDDLSAFVALGTKFGSGAAHTIERAVYVLLVTGGGVGPVLESDSKALFHADHANILTAGAPDQTKMQELVTKMMVQTGFGDDGAITTLNIAPQWTISGPTRAAQIEAIVKSPYSGSDARRDPQNSKVAMLDPIYVPQLETLAPNAYYGVASPAQAQTMEVAFLNGNQTPRTMVEQGVLVDGVTVVVDLDYGIAVTGGHEGINRNAGA